ncbi:PQQ-like beta-propeller repeat protein, partial [Alkalihalobacillus clausii]|uniref:outer membrane protein assembly factor BamB family protein n=1 Tax=Shouchella clausii TaxID=79880 RepID=UPI001C0B8BD8
ATGKTAWTSDVVGRHQEIEFNFGPRLLLKGDTVLFAGGDRRMHAYDLTSGKELWDAEHARGGYESPEDLMVTGDVVWCAPL